MHTKEEQSRSDEISTSYVVSSDLEGHSSIYVGTVFLLVKTTGFGSKGSEDSGSSLRYDIGSWTVRDSKSHNSIPL